MRPSVSPARRRTARYSIGTDRVPQIKAGMRWSSGFCNTASAGCPVRCKNRL